MRFVPNYNTMGLAKASLEASVRYLAANLGPKGIRVNGISAGPIKTLAASGIKNFGKILDAVASSAPLRRNVTIDDVGNVAAFLLSDLAAGVTSEITYVDCGFTLSTNFSQLLLTTLSFQVALEFEHIELVGPLILLIEPLEHLGSHPKNSTKDRA
jgi:enoyl-[acyl-carrier-protein] reductase (NADH)